MPSSSRDSPCKDCPLEDVRWFYNRTGDYFSKTRRFVWSEVWPYLQRLKKGNRVLDVGCGNGRLLTALPGGVDYTGIDFSKTLLSNARRLHPHKHFMAGDIISVATWKKLKRYDAIFCVAVLHHLPERLQQLFVLEQVREHLKPTGFVYLSVWNLWQFNYLKWHFGRQSLRLKVVNRDWRQVWVPFQGKYQRFCVAFTKRDLINLTTAAGLVVEELATPRKNLVLVARVGRQLA